MKTVKLFSLILCLGLMSSNLFGQIKAGFMAKMDAQVGTWVLDKESIKMIPASDEPIPNMKMVLAKDGEKYTRVVKMQAPDGTWVDQVSEVYEYDDASNMYKYTGSDMSNRKYHGQFVLTEEGNIHGIEFNSNNQKTTELDLKSPSATEMKASIKNFIYPQTADQDMMIIKVETTWTKQ